MTTVEKEVQSCGCDENVTQPPLPADMPCTCRVCSGQLEAKYQFLGLPDKPGYWFVTCWNRTCALHSVTRSAASYPTFDLTPYLAKAQSS